MPHQTEEEGSCPALAPQQALVRHKPSPPRPLLELLETEPLFRVVQLLLLILILNQQPVKFRLYLAHTTAKLG